MERSVIIMSVYLLSELKEREKLQDSFLDLEMTLLPAIILMTVLAFIASESFIVYLTRVWDQRLSYRTVVGCPLLLLWNPDATANFLE